MWHLWPSTLDEVLSTALLPGRTSHSSASQTSTLRRGTLPTRDGTRACLEGDLNPNRAPWPSAFTENPDQSG